MDKSPHTLLARRIHAVYDGSNSPDSLPDLCRDLVSHQVESWQECREGYETLKRVRVRDILCAGFSVRAQYNPGRIKSTMAGVEKEEVSARPCFLCLSNLPEGQKGILYRKDYLILCNPMPVFPSHFTVSYVEHRVQALEENFHTFLNLAADLGNSWTILYNGPRCGASAPDHLHFQVIPSGCMPIEKEIGDKRNPVPLWKADGICMGLAKNLGRAVILLRGRDPVSVGRAFAGIIQSLKTTLHESREPMMSVAGLYEEGEFRIMVFPRARHRPHAFFREGDDRLVVSPAVIEMGGVFITPVERDFKRLTRKDVEGIFYEVSLDGRAVELALQGFT